MLKPETSWQIDAERMATDAERLFMEEGYCCGESVLKAVCAALGTDNDLIPDIALGFGGGLGLQGHACGSLCGAVMAVAIGMAQKVPEHGARMMPTFEAAGRVCTAFAERAGATACRDLIGLDLTTPDGFAALVEREKAAKCLGFVKEAVRCAADELQRIAGQSGP